MLKGRAKARPFFYSYPVYFNFIEKPSPHHRGDSRKLRVPTVVGMLYYYHVALPKMGKRHDGTNHSEAARHDSCLSVGDLHGGGHRPELLRAGPEATGREARHRRREERRAQGGGVTRSGEGAARSAPSYATTGAFGPNGAGDFGHATPLFSFPRKGARFVSARKGGRGRGERGERAYRPAPKGGTATDEPLERGERDW
jgi:hypothetical protein